MSQQLMNLSHHFLISMPEMTDPQFSKTVTYILQHDEEGALGLIINRPLDIELDDIFNSVNLENNNDALGALKAYQGGPVSSEQGFVLHRAMERNFESSLTNADFRITSSRDILESIVNNGQPQQFLFCLGYSGWSNGQLEEELKQNAWLTVEADSDIIFCNNENEKYEKALAKLGVNLSALSGHGGMA